MTAKAATAGKFSIGPISKDNWLLLFMIVGVPLLLVVLWKLLPMNEYLRQAIDWIASTGWRGMAAFYLIYVVAAMVGIPRTPMHIAAGAVFSFPVAMMLVLASAASSNVATFTVARTVARDWVNRQIAQSPKVKQLLDLVEEEGFKLVLLIRMNPLIPGVLKGYGFGTTNISFRTYMAASVLGFLPIGLAHVYLGWAGGEAMLNENSSMTDVERWLLIGGVAVSVILVGGIYAYGKRALNRRYPQEKSS